jgi:hypothetical protein
MDNAMVGHVACMNEIKSTSKDLKPEATQSR